MSLKLIESQIEIISTSPHPPSQAAYCKGLTAMAIVTCVIDYQQQTELEHQISDLERQYWASQGIPA